MGQEELVGNSDEELRELPKVQNPDAWTGSRWCGSVSPQFASSSLQPLWSRRPEFCQSRTTVRAGKDVKLERGRGWIGSLLCLPENICKRLRIWQLMCRCVSRKEHLLSCLESCTCYSNTL
eukprot:3446815-Pleurochrysis_carterae.AAC.3